MLFKMNDSRNIPETLRAGLASMGENMFYTLNRAQQVALLQRSMQREQVEDCENGCEYPGTLVCDFCRALDYKTAEQAIQKVNQREIPSELVLIF